MRMIDIYTTINNEIEEQVDYGSQTTLNIRDLVLERQMKFDTNRGEKLEPRQKEPQLLVAINLRERSGMVRKLY